MTLLSTPLSPPSSSLYSLKKPLAGQRPALQAVASQFYPANRFHIAVSETKRSGF